MRVATLSALAGLAAAAAPSICDKYTTALLKDNTPANQAKLVTLLVKTAALGNYTGPGTSNPTLPGSMVMVPGILAPGMVNGQAVNLAQYFTGGEASTNVNGMPTAVNWLDNGSPAELTSDVFGAGKAGTHGYVLFTHLISYFGVLLGCSGYGMSGYPAYTGSNDMAAVHQYMGLSSAEFTYFVEQVGLSAQSFGAAKSDIDAAAMALNSTFGMACSGPAMVVPGTPKLPQAICQDSDCPKASPAMCGLYQSMGFSPSSVASAASEPATIMPNTYMGTASAAMSGATSAAMTSGAAATTMAASGSAPAASVTSFSGAAAPVATAAGHVLAAGALIAALL